MIADLAGAGVDFADVTATLEREGVESFAKSFHDALDTREEGGASSRVSRSQVVAAATARRCSAKSAGLACALRPLVFGIT